MSSVGVTKACRHTKRCTTLYPNTRAKPDTRRLLIARFLLSALGLIQRFHNPAPSCQLGR